MRRRLCRLAAIGTLAFAAVPLGGLLAAGPAGATAPSAHAYWVKTGTAPPTVPSGGLLVGQDPTSAAPAAPTLPVPAPASPPQLAGPTAISAVRITDVDPSQPATLTLVIASGSTAPNPSLAAVAACPIVTAWNPPSGGVGNTSQAPQYNCGSTPSTGKVAADMSAISWLLPADIQTVPGEYDVALVPAPSATPAPFTVAFDAPGPKSVQAASGPPPAAPPVTEPVVNPPDTVPSFVPSPPPATVTPSPSVGFGAVPTPPTTTAPASAPVTPTFVPRQLATFRIPGVSDDRAHRTMAVIVLFALAGAWWLAGGRPTPAPKRLGALAADGVAAVTVAPQEGGIGRFRHTRGGPPKRLF